MRAAILIAAACLLGGCYNYDPLITASPEPGTYVSLSLTDAGSQELARYLGPNVFIVRGRYLQHGDGGLLVSVASVELKLGNESIKGPDLADVADIAAAVMRRI